MREWFVIEDSRKNGVFAPDEAKSPSGYIPRDVAEKLLGRDLGGVQWFTKEEGDAFRAHQEWKTHLDPFNCPECGAHDFGLNRPACPHCGFTVAPASKWRE
jgi:ribosomal protein L37E